MIFISALISITLIWSIRDNTDDIISSTEVKIDIGWNVGHANIPIVPDSLLILPTEAQAKVDFEVENNDRDNDIDTIVVVVPGSEMLNGCSEWYDPNFPDHEWDFNVTDTDQATFVARDDWYGRVFGGSAQSDVVGNQDDALDHFSQNKTVAASVSEAVTVTVDFITSSFSGIKKGNDGIQVSIADFKTENTSSSLSPLYPNGCPYLLIDDGYEFIVIDVDSDKISLGVQYGSKTLFLETTRSLSDYKQEVEGINFVDDGHTYAILEIPSGNEVVKPIIKGKDNTTGSVEIRVQQIQVTDKNKTGKDLFNVIKKNITNVPIPPVGETYLDTDGDWIYDIEDNDDDNDNIPDMRDPEPLIPGIIWINANPTINSVIGPEDKVRKGDNFILSVIADDDENDTMTFTWKLEESDWTATGTSVTGPNNLEPGTYTFEIIVSDDKGGETISTISVNILEEDKDGDGIPNSEDTFPDNPDEWNDTDFDGFGDNSDAFISDPSASVDTDGDGYPDRWNKGMNKNNSTTGLTIDYFPNDITKWEKDEKNNIIPIIAIIIMALFIILLIIIIAVLLLLIKKKNLKEEKK